MVVDFVGICIKASKGVDLIVSDISDRGANKAGRALSNGGNYGGTLDFIVRGAAA